MKTKTRAALDRQAGWHIPLVFLVAVSLVPVLFAVFYSFKSLQSIYGDAGLFSGFTLENFREIARQLPIVRITLNTLTVAVLVTACKLLTSILAAYAFVFTEFRGKNVFYFVLISTIFIPFTVTMIPNYITVSRLNLFDSVLGIVLPQLADVTPEAVAVVELSSFQLISMRVSPKVAVVTNVTPNHLDHHKDMQEYIDAKRNILLWQVPPCRAVLGFENEISRGMQKDCKGEQVWFTRLHETDKGAFLRESDDTLCYAENGVVTPILPRAEVKLRGLHNVENLLAAIAAVWGRVPVEAMRQVGSTFTGVEHRIEPVRTLDGVTYYNDSIASSPTRTIAGLRSFNQKIILIAGGYDKKIPYEPLAPEILAHVKTLVLMGATGPRIEAAVRGCAGFDESALTILHADSMQHAVELARGAAQPGDVVSLSPASASFDLYPNFEVRGRDYKNIVNSLK